MKTKTFKTINGIVKDQLCCCCGTCVVICPQKAINMIETVTGLLVANANMKLCNNCGLCLKVCPGLGIDSELFPVDEDPFKGPIASAYLGYAGNSVVRQKGQSGGLATTILTHLLQTGQIDKALVTLMPNDGSLRPIAILTNNPGVVLESHGSKYCPVAVNEQLQNVKKNEKVAMVGLPCHFHGLTKLEKYLIEKNIFLKIGLVCERILSYHAIDLLIYKGLKTKKQVKTFRYKDKDRNGWPGDVCITSYNGKRHFLNAHARMQSKEYFTPYRCRLCFDKLNIMADLVLGDPHGIEKDKKGYSICFTRNKRAEDIICNIPKEVLTLKKIDFNSILKGQRINNKQEEYKANMDFARQHHLPFPLPLPNLLKTSPANTDGIKYSYKTGQLKNKYYIISKAYIFMSIAEIKRKYSYKNIKKKLKEILSK